MRRVITTIIVGLLIIVGITAVTVGNAKAVSHHRCSSTYDVGLGLHNLENGGQADWETNNCNGGTGYTMQTRVECRNDVTGADYFVYSGEVHGLEIDDWAACNIPDYVYDFWIDPHDTNNWLDV